MGLNSKIKLGLYGWNSNGIFVEGKGNFTEEDRKFLEWCMNNKGQVNKLRNKSLPLQHGRK